MSRRHTSFVSSKLADALVALKEPPRRSQPDPTAWTFETKANTLLAEAGAHRELSGSLAYDGA